MTKRALAAVPALKPIVLGAFTFHARGMDVRGRPSFEEYEHVGEFVRWAHNASPWWLADWLRYGENRTEWASRLSQAQHFTGKSEKRLKNIRAVGAIDQSRRRDVDFALHEEVAALPAEEQSSFLEQAETEGWDRRELRLNIRASRRRRVIDGQAVLEGMYRVIYADPPWSYRSNQSPDGTNVLAKAENHYRTLSIEDICKLPVAAHTMPDAVLFLWVTAPMLYENPGPREVIEAWGFTPKTGIVWDKVLGNFGHYTHVSHEHLIIATRGSCTPDQPTPQPDSVQVIRRSDVHSEKPEEFRQIITKLYTRGPYLELFGRKHVDGWSVFGDDAKLWAEEASEQHKGAVTA